MHDGRREGTFSRSREENLYDHLDTEERYLFTVTAQAHGREIEELHRASPPGAARFARAVSH